MNRTEAEREAEILANDAAYEELRRQSLANEADSSESNSYPETPNPTRYNPGPTSAEGLAISSRNALKHGCCSDKTIILAGERKEDYAAIEKMYLDDYKPKGELEKSLVQQIINAHWFHERATHAVNECEAQINDSGYMLKNWSDQNHLALARFLRYQTTRANNLKRAIKALEDHRKNRLNETIKIENHEMRKEKAKPELSLSEQVLDIARRRNMPSIEETTKKLQRDQELLERLKQR